MTNAARRIGVIRLTLSVRRECASSSGDSALDTGTGTGIAAFRAASFLGAEGSVTGNISNGMITGDGSFLA